MPDAPRPPGLRGVALLRLLGHSGARSRQKWTGLWGLLWGINDSSDEGRGARAWGRAAKLPLKREQRPLRHAHELGLDYEPLGVVGEGAGLQADYVLAGGGFGDVVVVGADDEVDKDAVGVAGTV